MKQNKNVFIWFKCVENLVYARNNVIWWGRFSGWHTKTIYKTKILFVFVFPVCSFHFGWRFSIMGILSVLTFSWFYLFCSRSWIYRFHNKNAFHALKTIFTFNIFIFVFKCESQVSTQYYVEQKKNGNSNSKKQRTD